MDPIQKLSKYKTEKMGFLLKMLFCASKRLQNASQYNDNKLRSETQVYGYDATIAASAISDHQ